METVPDSARITVFICANCARPGKALSSAVRARPVVPEFHWPGRVQQIVVPCAGRLQPEHLLKAFESGSGIVSVVACREDNCHYVEGSRRCARRIEYIRSILNEIGLGEDRLLLSHLPGSASEDLAIAAAKPAFVGCADTLDAQVIAIRDQAFRAFRDLPPNPLRQSPPEKPDADSLHGPRASGEDDDDE